MNTDTEYKLNEIKRDIRPEDFPEDSFWNEFVKDHGPGPMIDLVNRYGESRLYIPSYDRATKGARRRKSVKDNSLYSFTRNRQVFQTSLRP